MQSRTHPAKAELVRRRITIRAAAAAVPPGGCSPHFLGRVLNGYEPPTPRIVAGLAALLELKPEELFEEAALSKVLRGAA
jgi:hypothetical protein